MKTTLLAFFTIGGLFLFSIADLQASFAQSIEVSISSGTATPSCEIRSLCYIPDPITVTVGTVVEWTNHDSSSHTVTSGTPKDGPDGIVYSNLMAPDKTFAFKFDEPGAYPYFCMVHPWMEGLVIVEVSDVTKQVSDYKLTEQRISSDGSVIITIQTNSPDSGNKLPLKISFTDQNDELLVHMNYDIKIVQDDEIVMIKENMHSVDGTSEFNTPILESDNPIDIEIGIRGIYPSSETPRHVEDVMKFQKVPEFGMLAMLILGGSMGGAVYFLRKNRTNLFRYP